MTCIRLTYKYCIRFARKYTVRKAACIGLSLGLCFFAPATQANQNGQIDAVTLQFMNNAFDALSLAALLLEEKDAGQAYEGLVRARLSQGEFDKALIETGNISDNLWYARAMVSIADYLDENAENFRALEFLGKGLNKIGPDDKRREADETRRIIAIKQAYFGDLKNAQIAASGIHDQLFRIDTLQLAAAAHQEAANFSSASKQASAVVLRQAFKDAAQLETKSQSLIDIFLGIGRAQTGAGDYEGARATYYYARDRAIAGENQGRFSSYAKLASALVYVGDDATSMQILRKIDEGGDRGIALGAVARSMANIGKTDVVLPMFTLAFEQAQKEENINRRDTIYAQILEDQTTAGRLADAFTTAGAIRDRYMQSLALLRMGENLVRQGKFEEAYILVNYIPFLGMRAQIFADTAIFKATGNENEEKIDNEEEIIDRARVSAQLALGLEDTGFEPSLDHLPEAIQKILSIQMAHGDPKADSALFNRIEQLAYLLPSPIEQINALTYLATAQANRGEVAAANKTISAAWRIAWQNKYESVYAEALAKIARSQIAAADILSAFDTAARIPKTDEARLDARAPDGSFRSHRFDSLTTVAVSAARQGDTDLALRAAKQIRHPPARAAALAAIAVAIAAPEKSLREIVGIGPTDMRRYDILTVKYSNSPENEPMRPEEAIKPASPGNEPASPGN